jgi:hypothetical protein
MSVYILTPLAKADAFNIRMLARLSPRLPCAAIPGLT